MRIIDESTVTRKMETPEQAYSRWLNDSQQVYPWPSRERLSLERDEVDEYAPVGDGEEVSDEN